MSPPDWCTLLVILAVYHFLFIRRRDGPRGGSNEAFLPSGKHFMTADSNGNIETYKMDTLSTAITKKLGDNLAAAKIYTNTKTSAVDEKLASEKTTLNSSIAAVDAKIPKLDNEGCHWIKGKQELANGHAFMMDRQYAECPAGEAAVGIRWKRHGEKGMYTQLRCCPLTKG